MKIICSSKFNNIFYELSLTPIKKFDTIIDNKCSIKLIDSLIPILHLKLYDELININNELENIIIK